MSNVTDAVYLHLESPSPSERRAPGEDDGEAKLPRWLEIKVLLKQNFVLL